MRCAACGGLDFRPTMSRHELMAAYDEGVLPGDPDLGGACMQCEHFTEPQARVLDATG